MVHLVGNNSQRIQRQWWLLGAFLIQYLVLIIWRLLCLYHWADQPDVAAELINTSSLKWFHTTLDGSAKSSNRITFALLASILMSTTNIYLTVVDTHFDAGTATSIKAVVGTVLSSVVLWKGWNEHGTPKSKGGSR